MPGNAYGHFDDAAREYVVTRPDTPLPWLNYLGSDEFFALENMPETANAIPAVTVSLDYDLVGSVLASMAVLARKQVNEAIALLAAHIERNAPRLFMEIMDGDERVIPPVVADRQNARVAGLQDLVPSPAQFRAFLAEANHALGPVQHGIRISALEFDVHALIAPGSLADDG